MKTFLREVAEQIVNQHKDLGSVVLVLPSKRAGVFLRNELLSLTTKTSFGPQIHSIEEFVQNLSRLKLADNTTLLFEFYQVYKQVTPKDNVEDFYNFSRWANTILQDFNEIDRYLVDVKAFFNYLASVKEIDHWYLKDEKTALQKNYIQFWSTLNQYYTLFKERLLEKQLGYQGLIYREATENLNYYLDAHENKPHYFIGFNALNTAEALLIQEFLERNENQIIWDIDQYFIDDTNHDAGLFIRRYLEEWKYYQKNNDRHFKHFFTEEKTIEIIGIPKNIGQAHYTSQLLENLKKRPEGLSSTAIVLGNENLLPPLLSAMPTTINEVNITGGYPLYLSPVVSFFTTWFDLLENKNSNGWNHKFITNFFSHPAGRVLFIDEEKDYANSFLTLINTKNQLYISGASLYDHFPAQLHEICNIVFCDVSQNGISLVIENALSLCFLLKECYQNKGQQSLYLEYLYRLHKILNQIQHLNNRYQVIEHLKGFRHIFKELLSKETIDFKGEPVQGLQVMGVLESRNLDFETVIITSVNEGILPSGKTESSFIPFDMKTAFKLPTYKEKDAVYTYHFYHLLQRAKKIYLLYNSEPDVLEGGEKSRFILQLTLDKLSKHKITRHIAGPEVNLQPLPLLTIPKDRHLLERLKQIASEGFSPTGLTNYIRNPLDFYLQTVLGIKNEMELEETVASNTLGTVVHDTLEELYTPMLGQFLTKENLQAARKNIVPTVEKNFSKTYRGGDITRGMNLIIYKVALQYVEKFITKELDTVLKGERIKILQLETSLKYRIHIAELPFPVYLKGKADRIDEKEGIVRIIDYKTGKVLQNELELTEWEVIATDYKYSKAFQVLAYALMLKEQFENKKTEAGIISFKNYAAGFMRFATKESTHSRNKQYEITNSTFIAYEQQLKQLILEICNPEIPFTQKIV